MTRPLTCLTLLAAAGAGLYLYQEKHRAQLLDRDINHTIHATEQVRERTGMMRAEWALLNEPERLAGLAAQHLSLQTVTPAQFAQVADLGNRLPPVGAPATPPPALALEVPLAAILPAAKPALPLAAATPAPVLPQHPAGPMMVQATRLAHPVRMAKLADPAPTPVYAPVVQAFASQAPAAPFHTPTVQQASAGLSAPPYVGSALGMARTMLAAPVPFAPVLAPGGPPAQ